MEIIIGALGLAFIGVVIYLTIRDGIGNISNIPFGSISNISFGSGESSNESNDSCGDDE